ncbi:C4-dicarboxylate ABC transporter substrate-binding protein [Bradyrhizobium lablabi]|uniref:TAXI family TRAP transporter solute-binding subunit n=1 Tax=Bradyrhizobium lablabi TaxID=722472 RepID=UPI001BA4E793|nr:TAXI family TRAP transporter solute-binding subunit [Bradyrhizobium lablabi]MBR1125811.1 C4-dicarboxylate ABC transporter substrate-binding protein [Bradyrhizobium lablabi]
MSADIPTPAVEKPRKQKRVVKSNSAQIFLFAVLTVILTAAVVWGVRTWLKNTETLVFAVGDPTSPEARFAARLAAVLKNNTSRLQLRIMNNADSAKALAQFDRRQANLAVLRTDAKIPAHARSLAVLDRDVVLLLSPGAKKIKTIAELRRKKIAVMADSDSGTALVRNLLEVPDSANGTSLVQMAPPGASFEKLYASGFGAVVAIVRSSRLVRDKSFEQNAKRGVFTLNAIDAAKALARRNPALSEETIAAGTLSSSPAIPEEDVATVGLEWLLVANSRLSAVTAGDLARTIYENKAELALPDGFASKIEPADTDKDAFIVAHQGAAQYLNDDIKSFMERYSDLLYIGLAALGIIGSICATLYTKVTRVAPEKASELATALLDLGEEIQDAKTVDELDCLEDEVEKILRNVVIGLRDGTISSQGLDTFKLGYQFVRDEIGLRRESLKRHAAQASHGSLDDNVVVVKTAQSA